MTDRSPRSLISAFPYTRRLTTRWSDNDVYGHINNVVYYSFFDTTVNRFLIERGVLEPEASSAIGLVVETQCRFSAPIAFPDDITVGLRTAKIGNSSVRYEIGIFRNDQVQSSAEGHFVHVYVDRASRRPVAIPAPIRAVLISIAG
jgi:acyl-CoA thioester hydrolase